VVQTHNKDVSTDTLVESLLRDGSVIIRELAPAHLLDTIAADFRPHFDSEGAKFQNDFNGYQTLRLSAVLALSSASAELIAHPRILEIADATLLPHCECYRMGSATAIEILPGESAQELHRDDDFYPLRIPEVEFQIGAMWALDDFTLENGATQVAPTRRHVPDRV
jgi:hypothetical protein